jgi:hypothetical protein
MIDARKTRYEENEEIFNALAQIFIEPVANQFKCVYRPKARGKGITVDTDKIKQLENKMYELNRDLNAKAESQALQELGISKFTSYFAYEKINPKHLTETQLQDEWRKYNDLTTKLEKELRDKVPPTIKDEALCVQIGSELKSLERGSWIPVSALMGVQTHFLTRQQEKESSVVAGVFYQLTTKGNIFLSSEKPEQISSLAQNYASAETIVTMNKEHNDILKRIINPKLKKAECVKTD